MSTQEQLLKLKLDKVRHNVNHERKKEKSSKDLQMAQKLPQQTPPRGQPQTIWFLTPFGAVLEEAEMGDAEGEEGAGQQHQVTA